MYGILARGRVNCNERNFDERGKEMRCVEEAGHLDDRIGHRFEYVDSGDKPDPIQSESHYAIGARGMGWLT